MTSRLLRRYRDPERFSLVLFGYLPWLTALGASALVFALVFTQASAVAPWSWLRITALIVVIGTGYNVFSEWMNTVVMQGWKYADEMPLVRVAGVEIGLTPLLQWLLIPPLALFLGRRWRA